MMTNTISPTAAALRRRRVSLGLTQREVAILSGVSLATVQNIEGGLVPRRGTALGRIEDALADAERVTGGVHD